jgi:hypothetical protein
MARDHATTVNLAVAALVNHQEVDLLLGAGAFTNESGIGNAPEDTDLLIKAGDLIVGVQGDVSGDGQVTIYDASLILGAAVTGSTEGLPIHDAAEHIEDWLGVYGYSCDVDGYAADINGSGVVTAYDAAVVVARAAGISSLAPISSSKPRRCRLNISNYDDQKLEISIDLDDVAGVYSADVVMTYDPQALTVADVSRTSATSSWLSDQGIESGKLKISLAGASQPAAFQGYGGFSPYGSLVTVSFDVDRRADLSLRDAIRKLDIVELKLNDGMLRTAIEKLPEDFALLQNYPNPFNPETWIPYQLSEASDVAITIYNVNGQVVRRLELGSKLPGYYADKSRAAYWDGTNSEGERVSSGIYFYQLQAGRDVSVRKMIVVK